MCSDWFFSINIPTIYTLKSSLFRFAVLEESTMQLHVHFMYII